MNKIAPLIVTFGLVVQPALAGDYVPGSPIKFSTLGGSSSPSSSTPTYVAPATPITPSVPSSKSMDPPAVKTAPPKRPTAASYRTPANKYHSTAKPAPAIVPVVTPPASPSSSANTSSSSSTDSHSSKAMDSTPPTTTTATEKPPETTTTTTTTDVSSATPSDEEKQARRQAKADMAAKVGAGLFKGLMNHLAPGVAGYIPTAPVSSSGGAVNSGNHTTINNTYIVNPGDAPGAGKSGGSGTATSSVAASVMKKEPPVAQDNSPIKDKWALVVGVSKFEDKTIPQLRYSAKDARDFADFLIKEQHFAPDHVRVLCDEKATRAQIMSELGDTFFPRVVGEDDLALLFYSSHGSPANRDVGGANFLIAYDTKKNNLYATGIEMQELTRILRDRAHAKRILIVMDACHSGGGADGAKDAEDSNMNVANVEMGHGQLLISSSSASERSWESKNKPNGVFTAHLMDALRQNRGQTKLLDAVDQMKDSVNKEVQADFGATQHVTCNESKWTGRKLILGAIPSKPGPVPASVKQLLQPDSRGMK